MAGTVTLDQEQLKIQELIRQYLAARPTESAETAHLDHDTLSAFVEGVLSERESKPVVSHLVRCSFCRHISAELVRLNLAFEEVPLAEPSNEPTPGKISEVLSGLFSRIFGTADGAVFAHTEEEKKENGTDKKEKE
ncbi:hypothetical protein [Leptolyngbya sp. 7M]|uniref:hypothetical protein n=1 Tax=Leptolyngbya sp. 7M TaxID=2812896 RepID=UPI001B8C8AC6|nr:hypothetical protein [Leptolyngbya sp. 7M]QYO65534.1 hypothetical protein JVX88_01735 [Leptolyngbya sp. 7M]